MQKSESTDRTSRNFGQQAGSARIGYYKEQGVQVGTYPDMEQKCAARQLKQKDSFPRIEKTVEEVLFFLRGKKEYVLKLKNAFIKDRRVLERYGGVYVGMSDDIVRYEGDLYRGLPEACYVLLRFKDMANAERWTQSSPIFKQKDWPSPADELEMFAMGLSYLPTEGLTAFQLTEMHGLLTSPEEFQEHYVTPVAKKLNEHRIYHGVVASNHINRLRNCMLRPDTFVVLHCAESPEKLKKFYDSTDYRAYRDYRQAHFAENDSCFFTIRPTTS